MQISNVTALVLEDHDFQRDVARRTLQAVGVKRVLEASDGHAALAELDRDSNGIDVVIADLYMPQMDGVEFLRHVASRPQRPALIILSGLEPAMLRSAEAMAAHHGLRVLGTIEKPLTVQKLRNTLQRLAQPTPDAAQKRTFARDELERALAANEFCVALQPQIVFDTRKVFGAEVLARWQSPAHGFLMAGDFIQSIVDAGLEAPFTWAIFDQSCAVAKRLRAQAIDLRLSVNMSQQFLEQINIADQIHAKVLEAGLEPAGIAIEVTEALATSKYGDVIENLARLRLRGFALSIDDYGTGYSSAAQLMRIPFSELKVDQSFVRSASTQPATRSVLETALSLAHKLGLHAVAEGVETEDEWQFLNALKCDSAQGYYFSEPLPEAEFVRWYQDWTGSIT